MTRTTLWLTGVALSAMASVALAHGGAYQPPPPPMPTGGAVPPGPQIGGPTTGGGGPGGGPLTPSGGPTKGPITPSGPSAGGGGPGGGPTTPGGGTPTPTTPGGVPTGPVPGAGIPGAGVTPTRPSPGRSSGPGVGHWTRWWYPNRLRLIEWSARVGDQAGDTTPGGRVRELSQDLWRAEAQIALAAALNHDNEDIASGAAIALGKAGDPAQAGALVRVLQDAKRQQPVREAAALALGLLPVNGEGSDHDVRRALEHIVRNGKEPTRLRATSVYSLGLRGEPASAPLLLEAAAAGEAQWDVPAAAVSALGLAGYDLTQPDLLQHLEGPRRRRKHDSVRRAYAAHALSFSEDQTSLEALREAATDSDRDVQRAAIMALGARVTATDVETVEVLIRVLHREKDGVSRQMASIALGRSGHEKAEASLRHAYLKGDGMLQPFAAIGLGLLARHPGRERAARVVVRDLETRANSDLRGALAIAVGLSRDPTGAPILRELAGDRGDPQLRGHAALAIGLMDDRTAGAPILRRLITDVNDPNVQREAALGLGMLGDREGLRILKGLLEDGSTVYAQGSAAVALGRIGGQDAGSSLLDLLKDDKRPDIARGMAAVGLGLLLDRSEGRRLAKVGADLNWYLFTPTVHEILTIL